MSDVLRANPVNAIRLAINGLLAKAVIDNDEKLRVLRGTVDASGSVTVGAGFDVIFDDTRRIIVFDAPFAAAPTVVAQLLEPADLLYEAIPDTPSTTQVRIPVLRRSDGVRAYRAFSFIAIGPA